MTRTNALALTLTILMAGSASALPDRFTLQGTGGATGTIELDTATRAVSISVTQGAETIALAGTLGKHGQGLKGSLRPGNGLVKGLNRVRRARAWTVRVQPRGLAVSVSLKQGKRHLALTGETPLGARHAANEAVIRTFYEAFARSDAETMAAQYASTIHFSDPVFPNLHGASAGNMWRMLCESKPQVTFSGVQADARYGRARWVAKYEVFGRPVTNVIDASFELKDGKIVRHVDHFSFKTWAGQAFGKTLTGFAERPLLSVTRFITARRLKTFEEAQQPKPTRRRRAPK